MSSFCVTRGFVIRFHNSRIPNVTFTVPLGKEVTRNDKNGKKITKNICYILQFIDGARFMTSSLSNLVSKLSERIHRNRRKFLTDDKKFETFGIKCKCCDCFLKYKPLKMI